MTTKDELKIVLEATDKTPNVSFDLKNGKFYIEGRSIPEDTSNFYVQLLPYVYKYGEKPSPQTEVHICLEYFNTSTMKFLSELFRELIKQEETGKTKATVYWYYYTDDDAMRESGEEFQEYFPRLSFKLIEKPPPD